MNRPHVYKCVQVETRSASTLAPPVRKKFKPQVSVGQFMLTVFWDLEAEDPGFCDYVKVKHIEKDNWYFCKINDFHL